jgi:hypothetical protein
VSSSVSTTTSTVTSAISTADARPSQPIRAGVPRSVVPSNQYRRRSRHVIRTTATRARPPFTKANRAGHRVTDREQ